MRVVAQRPSLKARRNVSACCPNNGQRVAVGRKGGEKRVHEEYHSRLTFLFKTGAPFCLSPLRPASTIFVLKPRVMFLSNIYPLPSPLFLLQSSCFSFFFFCQSSVLLHQNCVAFCRRRRPDGGCLHVFSRLRLR